LNRDEFCSVRSNVFGSAAEPRDRKLRTLLLKLLALSLVTLGTVQARTRFDSGEIAAGEGALLVGDLDGDGLKDLVVVNETNLFFYYQGANPVFGMGNRQSCPMERVPALVCAGRSSRGSDSVFILTSAGVDEVLATNRQGMPLRRTVIHQPMILPAGAQGINVQSFAFAAERRGAPATLLVPVAEGLQVWQCHGGWHCAQTLKDGVERVGWVSAASLGRSTSMSVSLSVQDVNGDGRDDLMIRRGWGGQTNSYELYLQQTNGQFGEPPAMVWRARQESDSWLCWTDLNRDGRIDLIQGHWLDELSLIPGIPSGKVMVGIFTADERGILPAKPQQVFRKHDWIARVPVADIDGDGYPDLVLGYGSIDTREGLRKQVTAKQLDYSLAVHLYRKGAGFPAESDFRRKVLIHLDRSALLLGTNPEEYYQRYVRLEGDFHGDGRTALMVRDRAEEISAYCFVSRAQGFSEEADFRFKCSADIQDWEVADLNGDGISDLMVRMGKDSAVRVFMSRK
jgi:hypothetical protein